MTIQNLFCFTSPIAESGRRGRFKKKPDMYTKELIELLFDQPYCRIATLVDGGIVARKYAAIYLRELEKIGILKSEKVGREVIFKNIGLFNLFNKHRTENNA